MSISCLSGLALVLCLSLSIKYFNVREMLPTNDWLDIAVDLTRGDARWRCFTSH